MPIIDDLIFTDPKGENIKLWRYIDFNKFESLLKTSSLFFTKGNVLKECYDTWEGSVLKKQGSYMLEQEGLILNGIAKQEKSYDNDNINDKLKNYANNRNIDFREIRNRSFISCWHCNVTESVAMWELYLKGNAGIAIKTSIDNFKRCFQKFEGEIIAGEVKYMDYETGYYEFRYFDFLQPLFHKRKIYEHEKEYRAIFVRFLGGNQDVNLKEYDNGVFIPIDLKILVEEIILAPSCPEWFLKLIKDTLKKFDFDFEVKRSVVDDNPFEFNFEQLVKDNFLDTSS